MNSRPLDEETILDEIFDAFFAAQSRVTTWPTHDLYADFDGPTLAASTDSLSFTSTAGNAVPPAQTVLVTTSVPVANTPAASYTVSPPVTGTVAPWLRFDRTPSSPAGTLRVLVEPAGLAAGDYPTLFTISSPTAGNQPRYVRVSLRVVAPARVSTVRNSASWLPSAAAAPVSRLTIEAPDLAAEALSAEGVPVDGPLGGVTVRFGGPVGQPELTASIVAVAPGSVGAAAWLVDGKAEATVSVVTHRGQLMRERLTLEAASPALFSASRDGVGAALATYTRTTEDSTVTSAPAFECVEGVCLPVAIDLGPETSQMVLQLAATGVRQFIGEAASLGVRIGEESAEILAIEASTATGGVELITVRLPRSLIGKGELDVTLSVAGKTSNAVKIAIAASPLPPE